MQLDLCVDQQVSKGDGPVHKLSLDKVGANAHKFVRVQVKTRGFGSIGKGVNLESCPVYSKNEQKRGSIETRSYECECVVIN